MRNTILIAHNIDLAARVPVQGDDAVRLKGNSNGMTAAESFTGRTAIRANGTRMGGSSLRPSDTTDRGIAPSGKQM
jgi:hypothetical protein